MSHQLGTLFKPINLGGHITFQWQGFEFSFLLQFSQSDCHVSPCGYSVNSHQGFEFIYLVVWLTLACCGHFSLFLCFLALFSQGISWQTHWTFPLLTYISMHLLTAVFDPLFRLNHSLLLTSSDSLIVSSISSILLLIRSGENFVNVFVSRIPDCPLDIPLGFLLS